MNKYFLLSLILLCFGCVKNKQPAKVDVNQIVESLSKANNKDWSVKRVEGSKLLFKNGEEFDTKLYGLEYVGQVRAENKAPFLIYFGVDCIECDAEQALYIHSPDDGELLAEDGRNSYQFPGKLFDYETDSLLYEGRAFYGEVLKNKRGVIWYQNAYFEQNKSWKKSVFFVDLSSGGKVESFLEGNSQMEETLAFFEIGLCKEIEPYDQRSMP